MNFFVWPTLYALFLWWFTTGIIIYLDHLPPRTFGWSMLGWTALLAVALHGLAFTSRDTSVYGAYAAFTYALLAWGWMEISFYLGYVTGPRKSAPPHPVIGWARFRQALETTLHHEFAIIAAFVVILATTWGEPNKFGLWTFMVLWWMHESARINVFLGVLNLNLEFFPPHLRYLAHYLRKKPMNLFFPISITVSMVGAVMLIQSALTHGGDAFHAVGFTMLAAMLVLAILEHWLLVLPIPAAILWRWSLSPRLQEDKAVP